MTRKKAPVALKQSAKAVSTVATQSIEVAEAQPSRKLNLSVAKGASMLDAAAAQAQDPVTKAASVTSALLSPVFGELDLMGSVRALQALVAGVQSGDMRQSDAMLVAEANTLDSIFHECLRLWMANKHTNHQAAQDYLKAAMKAQSQARTTWEAISKIHNPCAPSTFVKQANIANGPQQVNNGGLETSTRDGAPVRMREIENKPNELMELGHGKRMDSGAAGAAVEGDPPVATVGKRHRTAVG